MLHKVAYGRTNQATTSLDLTHAMINGVNQLSSPMTPIPSMDTSTYPGKGLSLPQLVYALNEELRNKAHPPPYVEREHSKPVNERDVDHLHSITLEEISQLERGILTALGAVRESKNSFVPINRIPLDVLCLIPTHLPSHKDRFRASFVCRHWRKAIIQRGSLWSQLFLIEGEDYVKTLLERAKGSALDVVTNHHFPLSTTALLSPHAQQIKNLKFALNCCDDISTFSQVGPLPLLRTLKIRTVTDRDYLEPHDMTVPPNLPLFSGSINLEEFDLAPHPHPLLEGAPPLSPDSPPFSDFHEGRIGPLSRFVFPALTTFKLTGSSAEKTDASDLLNFLEASPMLRTVEVETRADLIPTGIPRDKVIVLPNIETFSLSGTGSVWPVHTFAVHISCPRSKRTSLINTMSNDETTRPLEIFPVSTSWMAIVHQYSTSPVEEITLETSAHRITNTYSLTFQSSDTTFIRLGLKVNGRLSDSSFGEARLEIFSQACGTIRGHPLLSHVKRLHIKDTNEMIFGTTNRTATGDVVEELFSSLGPLDELTFQCRRLSVYLDRSFNLQESRHTGRAFPLVKGLTIPRPLVFNQQWCMNRLEEVAKSQHKLGRPFERLTVPTSGIPAALVKRLRKWIGSVDFYDP